MSNRATIMPTKFVDLSSGTESFGVRVFDNYGQTYDNTWDSIPEDPMDILKKVLESDDEVTVNIVSYIAENQAGIYVGDTWYDWEEIKDYLIKDYT